MGSVERAGVADQPMGAQLMRAFARGTIPHCYWKASLHLPKALVDPTKDLDVLIADAAWARSVEILRELGYRRMAPPAGAAVLPGIESWLGFDAAKGRFDHVHLHSKLYSGRAPIYEWRLPWEQYLLRHLERHPELDLAVLDPALEVVLLAVRAVLEPQLRDGARLAPKVRHDLARLAVRANPTRVREHAAELLGDAAADVIASPTLTSEASFAPLKRSVELALEPSRRLPRAMARAAWAAHAAASVARGVGRRVGTYDPPRPGLRRPGRGLLVAVLGADGAGKTTQTHQLRELLGQCLAVEGAYLGRGDWVSAAQQVAAEIKWGILETLTSRRRPPPSGPIDHPGTGVATTGDRTRLKHRALQLARDAARVAMAGRKRRDLDRAARLRRAGVVVVTDRFPHPEIMELDGPGVQVRPGDPKWRQTLAALERREFARMRCTPDVVIRLRLDPRVAHARKPDHRLEDIERKAAALDVGTYPGAKVFDVDAAQPLEVVAERLGRIVWETL